MPSVKQLKAARLVWSAGSAPTRKNQVYPLGQPALDDALQGGLAPYGLSIVCGPLPYGELNLFRNTLQQALKHKPYLALINPPGVPNNDWFTEHLCTADHLFYVDAQSKQDNLWAFEQSIASGACGAVVGWHLQGDHKQIRRCHMRAIRHQCHAIWFTADNTALANIPCNLILHITHQDTQWRADIQKQQGGWPRTDIALHNPLPLSNSAIVHALQDNIASTLAHRLV